jgi:hypothetical protein
MKRREPFGVQAFRLGLAADAINEGVAGRETSSLIPCPEGPRDTDRA